jgi:hypothetical protein
MLVCHRSRCLSVKILAMAFFFWVGWICVTVSNYITYLTNWYTVIEILICLRPSNKTNAHSQNGFLLHPPTTGVQTTLLKKNKTLRMTDFFSSYGRIGSRRHCILLLHCSSIVLHSTAFSALCCLPDST